MLEKALQPSQRGTIELEQPSHQDAGLRILQFVNNPIELIFQLLQRITDRNIWESSTVGRFSVRRNYHKDYRGSLSGLSLKP